MVAMTSSATRIISEFLPPRLQSRFYLPALLLSAFAIAALLYLLAPTAYFALLRFWGLPVWDFPFLDLHAILSALECTRQGIDVMQANPCDELARPHIYSPLWLAPASFLPVQPNWLMPTGVCLDLMFILSLYRLPAVTCLHDRAILGMAVLSPVTLYALERGNNDLVIFLMIIVAVPLALASWRRRIAGYSIFLFAGLLKYYPMALLLLLVRERPKRFWALVAAATFAITIFFFWYRPELVEDAAVIGSFQTSPYTDVFDFTNFPIGIVALEPDLVSWLAPFGIAPRAVSAVIFAILLASFAGRVWRINQNDALGAGLVKLPPSHALCLVIGATLIVGCFFAGRSVLYRGIFFLLTLPGLLSLARAAPHDVARTWLRPCIAVVLFLMWSDFFRHRVHDLSALLPSSLVADNVEMLFWAAKELTWWWVTAVFCGLLLHYVSISPAAAFLRSLPGFRRATVS
jgi:hypothetical protein